jgi:HEAT repeat protein
MQVKSGEFSVLHLAVVGVVGLGLGGCGKAPPPLAGGKPVGHWVAALRGPDAAARQTAAFKLGNVGPADAAVLPALTGALHDPDARVRCAAILALLKCGRGAAQAVPDLTRIQQEDRNAKVRAYAAKALEKLR